MPLKDKQKRNAYALALYYRHHDRYKLRRRKYYYENRFRSNGNHYQLKRQLMDILNQEDCVKCAFSDIRGLTFDHIYGDGSVDYTKGKGRHGISLEYYIGHPLEAVAKLQVLCHNCNHIKKLENEEFRGWAWGYKNRK